MNAGANQLLGVCLMAALATACGGNLTVSAIQVGKSLNSDNSVAVQVTTFKRNDTIYAAILTEGTGSATLGARFSYGGRVISEPERRVSYRGAAATEFHIEYSGGFPPGDYDIELFMNGMSVGMRRVRVEA
jgi:hypothetical protein